VREGQFTEGTNFWLAMTWPTREVPTEIPEQSGQMTEIDPQETDPDAAAGRQMSLHPVTGERQQQTQTGPSLPAAECLQPRLSSHASPLL